MANSDIFGAAPGLGATRTAAHRKVFLGNEKYLPGNHVIAGADARDPLNTPVSEIRAGLLLGEVSASGKLGVSIIGVTTNAEAVASTAVEAAAAVVTELSRREGATGTFLLVGPAVAGGPVNVETVTYSGFASSTAITVTALTNAFVAGSLIMATDGSANIRTIIPDGYPIRVLDENDSDRDVQLERYPIAGIVDSSQIINWPADAALKEWIVAQLPHFQFDHHHQ